MMAVLALLTILVGSLVDVMAHAPMRARKSL